MKSQLSKRADLYQIKRFGSLKPHKPLSQAIARTVQKHLMGDKTGESEQLLASEHLYAARA